MPAQMKRRRGEGGAASGERPNDDEVLRETLHQAVNASVEAARKRAEEEAAKVTAAAEATRVEVEGM